MLIENNLLRISCKDVTMGAHQDFGGWKGRGQRRRCNHNQNGVVSSEGKGWDGMGWDRHDMCAISRNPV
jgi:hypothetical protein